MNKKTLCATALPFVIATSLTVVGSFAAQADVVDHFQRSIDGSAASNLRLENINGDVEITAWDQNYIDISATITAETESDRERIRILVAEHKNSVSVETKYQEKSWRNGNGGQVTYDIKVPAGTNLADIDLVNGELSVEKVKGEVNADVVNGSIHSDGLAADLQLNVVNGSIHARLDEVNADIEEINLQTVNGTINLTVPEDISASIDAETMHGRIKSDFALDHSKGMFVGREASGSIGNGDISIRLETVNGGIKIRKH